LKTFEEGAAFRAPLTHLYEFRRKPLGPGTASLAKDAASTGLLAEALPLSTSFPGLRDTAPERYRYGYIGLNDRRMAPILRPGSMVLVDTVLRTVEDANWSNEYDRPLYFVETRSGYRCGWFQKQKSRLIMQPHTLSRCAPEVWRTPAEAEILGKVVGVITYLNEPWPFVREAARTERSGWNEKDP